MLSAVDAGDEFAGGGLLVDAAGGELADVLHWGSAVYAVQKQSAVARGGSAGGVEGVVCADGRARCERGDGAVKRALQTGRILQLRRSSVAAWRRGATHLDFTSPLGCPRDRIGVAGQGKFGVVDL